MLNLSLLDHTAHIVFRKGGTKYQYGSMLYPFLPSSDDKKYRGSSYHYFMTPCGVNLCIFMLHRFTKHVFREAELYPSFKHFNSKTVLFSGAQPFPSLCRFYITTMALVDLDKLQSLCVKEALS